MRKQGARLRRWLSAGCALALVCACTSPPDAAAQAADSAATPPATTGAAAGKSTAKRASSGNGSSANSGSHKGSSRRSGKKKTTARGQQKIDSQRAQEIQGALIREHYLSGEAGGTWNQSSEDAMRRYQADHGWQSKQVPDARALISLGLGPSHDHLLNPESAMTTEPVARAASLTPVSHSADPGPRMSTIPASSSVPAPTPAVLPEHDVSGPQ